MAGSTFRVHPAIGFARVGNSEEYYLAPETMASLPVPGDDGVSVDAVSGGLPIKRDTESEHITSSDLRDDDGALRRQAARFRIYHYDSAETESYPNGEGTEVKIGTDIEGKKVLDIVWTVHLANKKANCYVLEWPPSGLSSVIANYERGLPPLRNRFAGDPNSPDRIRKLTIDPGPRAIRGTSGEQVEFDAGTPASFWNEKSTGIEGLPTYPKSFPLDGFPVLYSPSGDIDTLGQLETDDEGRLIVIAGYGRACAWFRDDGTPFPLADDVDNDGWFDDTADGPVSAVLVFDDNSTATVHGGWVVATDPAYAPQTPNVVTLWDDIFDTWVRKLDLMPELFQVGYKKDTFEPSFDDHIHPIFRTTAMQRWNTYLPRYAIEAHDAVGQISATDDPSKTILGGLGYIRNPNNPNEGDAGVPLMPLSLGDAGQPFLSPTFTQYFFLSQWDAGKFSPEPGPTLGDGEYLDKASLFNCLGGRFSPGIDMTFTVRDPELWTKDWRTSGGGPFRIKATPLDYTTVRADRPFLTQGYVPIHTGDSGAEPGDTSKFMALPWHTDYNSCATHPTSPNPDNNQTVYWSWPAQRPVSVYVAADVEDRTLPHQQYSVRGPGTASPSAARQGRYADRLDIITHWSKIGVVIQANAIDDDKDHDPDHFLEVESQLEVGAHEPVAQPWPIDSGPS
ncbi:MAG: LodA/GoxA family CTQ-dependent oxidase [Pseudonocardiaceae bacterium]